MLENVDKDLAKELIVLLSYLDNEFVDNIPDEIITKYTDLAADSDKDFYFDASKKLNEQDISEDCKDLVALLYHMYAIDNTKDEILKNWYDNEKK